MLVRIVSKIFHRKFRQPLEYYIFDGQKKEIKEFAGLYREILKNLYKLDGNLFLNELKYKVSIKTDPDEYGKMSYDKLDEIYYFGTNFSNAEKLDKAKYALEIFGLEDDLMIKYAG